MKFLQHTGQESTEFGLIVYRAETNEPLTGHYTTDQAVFDNKALVAIKDWGTQLVVVVDEDKMLAAMSKQPEGCNPLDGIDIPDSLMPKFIEHLKHRGWVYVKKTNSFVFNQLAQKDPYKEHPTVVKQWISTGFQLFGQKHNLVLIPKIPTHKVRDSSIVFLVNNGITLEQIEAECAQWYKEMPGLSTADIRYVAKTVWDAALK